VEESGLRYVTYSQPGISRIRSGTGFRYLDPEGRTVREPDVLARIQSLAIPPAWTEVWICTLANGHLQAVGRDARGRRQYRYHPRWREIRDAAKFDELLNVARALPVLRRRVDEDLLLPLLPREKVLAAVVWLLETTLIRVGNEEYARDNQSFGLTTLEDRHTLVEGLQVRFEFQGKSGKQHVVGIQDERTSPGSSRRCVDRGPARNRLGSATTRSPPSRFSVPSPVGKQYREGVDQAIPVNRQDLETIGPLR